MTDAREQAAEAIVREAVLASVALVKRDVDKIDVPAPLLLEGTDPGLVSEVLARIVSVLLDATLPDGGRQLLVTVSRRIVEGEPQ